MAPDKIYVHVRTSPRPSITFSEAPEENSSNVEYIRKDALLGIIETARQAAIVQRNFNNCPAEQEARIDAYDYIKHRIESL